MQIKYFDLFPTRIWTADLAHLRHHFEKWREAITLLRNSDMKKRGNSNRLGWNSQPVLASNVFFRPLFLESGKVIKSCLGTTALKNKKFALEGWANINDRGGFNNLHGHPGAVMSACFYLTVPKGSGPLVFRTPNIGALTSEFQGQGCNSEHYWTVNPAEGMLVVFPAWLDHKVEPHDNDIPRVSIAMNAIKI